MNKLKNKKVILYIVIAIIIIIGSIICGIKGFNIEILYSNRQEITISNNIELDISKVKEISKSVLTDRKVCVQHVERFNNAVQIISTSISEEEKENLVNKINEEMGLEISNDEINIISVANTRIRDILKPYIMPGIISFIIIIVYFAIMYNKIGLKKILLKSILVPIITEATFYSLIAITRLPFGRITSAIAIGLYIISIGFLTVSYQKEKENLTISKKKEND